MDYRHAPIVKLSEGQENRDKALVVELAESCEGRRRGCKDLPVEVVESWNERRKALVVELVGFCEGRHICFGGLALKDQKEPVELP